MLGLLNIKKMNRKFYIFVYLFILESKRILFKKKYYAEFDVTDNCNLNCKHCYHFSNPYKIFQKKEVAIDIWEKRFSQLYKDGIRFVLLGGGEPALRKDIIELAHKIFPIVYIITNGKIKIPEKLVNLIIFLSLDGDKEKNDEIRGVGSFEKAINNYCRDKRVIINMTLMKNNFVDLEKIIKISKNCSFRGVVCNIYNNAENKADPLILNKKERVDIIHELYQIKKRYPKNLLLTKSMINWYAKKNHTGYCYWGDEVLHFDVLWKNRRCFSGLNCENCGCFAGAMQSPLTLFPNIEEAFKFI